MNKYYARKKDGEILVKNDNGTYSFISSLKLNSISQYPAEAIVNNPNFMPIFESDFPTMEARSEQYYAFLSWHTRSDGHGGIKGGTFEEWLKLTNQTKI